MNFLRSKAGICFLILTASPLLAQDDGGSLEGVLPPPVDLIQPVPPPEIPPGALGETPTLPENLKIDNLGGTIDGDPETGIRLGGPVRVRGDNGLEIFSDRANVDLKQKSVTFEGNVSVYQGNILQRGDRAIYFYEKSELDASSLRISLDPILLESGKFTSVMVDGERIFTGQDAGITTHDVQNPDYWIRADTTTVYPGDRITFQNLKLYAGETPVFWLPYLSQPMDGELGYQFFPGARSNWGPYLLNTYGVMLGGKSNPVTGDQDDAWLLSRWRLDLRATRGAAVGLDLVDTRQQKEEEITGFSFYYAYDLDPENTRNGIPRNFDDPSRYHLKLQYRTPLDFENNASWRFDANLNHLSDRFYLEDFDVRNFITNPAPDNTLGFFRRDDESLLSIFGRFRLNDFYRTDTHYPEIAFDQVRRPFFNSPVLHEGSTSFTIRDVQAADFTRNNIINPLLTIPTNDPQFPVLLSRLNGYERTLVQRIRALAPGDPQIPFLRAQLLDTGFNRFHTNHSFSLPFTHEDWFTLTPRIGGAFTNYSSVQGPSDSDSRLMFHGGIEAAVKFSKNYPDLINKDLGFDGLLHIFQPYVNWSVVDADELENNFPIIDRLTFTTRPRSLDPMRFTATDEFEDWNIVRFGARNHLITRRDDQSHDWLFVDTYFDYYINDPEGDRTYSNLYNDFYWQPLPWLGIELETQIPVFDGSSGFSELATRARFMPHENFEASIAFRHLNDHPVLLNSNRIELDTYIRLSENWGLGSRHIFEMQDTTLEIQQYTLQRDLGEWVAGIGLSHRDNRFEDEFGIIFTLSLKNFPSVSLPFRLAAE